LTRLSLRQIALFAVVGAGNTAIDFGLFNALTLLLHITGGAELYILNAFSVAVAIVFSYFANGRLTFGTMGGPRAFSRFLVISLSTMLVNSAGFALVMVLAHPTGFLGLNAAKLSAAVISATLNFIGYRTFVFRRAASSRAATKPISLVSVVIPAFNEGRRLLPTLEAIAAYARVAPWPLEVTVVDDGSTDDTAAVIRHQQADFPVALRLIPLAGNHGKGRAVRVGLGAARGDIVLFTDADNSVPITQLPGLVAALEGGAHMAIGQRSDPGEVSEATSLLRRTMGRIYRRLVGMVVLPGIPDPQCGFKAMWRDAIPALIEGASVDGFAFDAELLMKAQRKGLAIAQVPVDWTPVAGSTVRPLVDAPKTLADLLALRTGLKDAVLPLVILIAAGDIFLRLPNLFTSPGLGAEWSEVLLAYRIFQGRVLPLTNVAPTLGSAYNVMLAGLFHIFGPSIYLPRIFVMVLSLATIVLIYMAARRFAGAFAGLIAAVLLATSGADILASHAAWSVNTAPFFVMLATLLFATAERRGRWYWALAGVALGVAWQTNFAVVALVPAFILAALLGRGQAGRRDGRIGLGLAGLIFGYANVIVWNIIHPMASLRWLFSPTGGGVTALPSPSLYLAHAGHLVRDLATSLPGVGGPASAPTAVLGAVAVMAVAWGAFTLARQRVWLPVLALASSLVIMPYITNDFALLGGLRVLIVVLPFALMATGAAVVDLVKRSRRLRLAPKHPAARLVPLAAGLAFMAMTLSPLSALAGYYAARPPKAGTSTAEIQLARFASAHQGDFVVVAARATKSRFLPDLLTVAGATDATTASPGLASLALGRSQSAPVFLLMSPAMYRQFVSTNHPADPDPVVVSDHHYIVLPLPAD